MTGQNAIGRTDDDRGLAMVLVALVMVVLLVFAAFVVDVGAVYNLRRQDQSAADSAALAAAQELSSMKDRDRILEEKFQEAKRRAEKDKDKPFINPMDID